MSDLPIYIVTRDRVSDLRRLVAWLELAGCQRIVLLDNDSAYEPMIDFLHHTSHQVVSLGRNLGARALWEADLVPRDEYFVYTDPDIVPIDDCPLDAIEHLRDLLDHYQRWPKAALGLYLDDVPVNLPSLAWERSLVSPARQLEPGVFASLADTTLAVYRPGSRFHFEALRTGHPYQAVHSPWYQRGALDAETAFYLGRAEPGSLFSSWKTRVG